MRRAESVFDEIVWLERQGLKFFAFLDDLTTLHRRRLERLCNLLIGRGGDIQWGVESRVDTLTPSLCQLMYRAGCRGIHFGVESGNDETLRAIRKGITREQVFAAAAMAHEARLQVICSFIVGHPSEDAAQVRRTFEFARELHTRSRAMCLFSALTPFPGTELYRRSGDFGISIHARSFSEFTLLEPIVSTRHIPLGEFRQLMREARAVEDSTSVVRERLERLASKESNQ